MTYSNKVSLWTSLSKPFGKVFRHLVFPSTFRLITSFKCSTYLSRSMTKQIDMICVPSDDQTDQSSLSTWRNLGSLAALGLSSQWREDFDQTWQMPRLMYVFRLAHRSFCWFCHAAAHLWPYFLDYSHFPAGLSHSQLKSITIKQLHL